MSDTDESYLSDLIELKSAIDLNPYMKDIVLFRHDAFEVFSLMYKLIDSESRNLISKFLENYLIIFEYRKHTNAICDNIEDIFFGKNVAICPTIEGNKLKSGHVMLYEVRSSIDKNKFNDLKFILSQNDLKKFSDLDYDIIIVDDFIGSGNQISSFIKNSGLKKNKTHIYTIVLQDISKINIIPLVGELYSSLPPRKKAITDGFSIGALNVADAQKLYEKIESLIDINMEYSYGYEKTEALVTMKRTPNNTLPIFWHSRMKGGRKWPSPFPR